MIFDFHAHPTFKPFNSSSIYHHPNQPPDPNMWRERFRMPYAGRKLPRKLEAEVNYTSQTHLNGLGEGTVRGMVMSFYPLERVFTAGFNYRVVSILFRGIAGFVGGAVSQIFGSNPVRQYFFNLVATLTGFDPKRIRQINEGGYNYYNMLVQEYNYFVSNQNQQPGQYNAGISYGIAKNFDDYTRIINEGKIAFITSVEGTNVFLDDSTNYKSHLKKDKKNDTERNKIRDIVKSNVIDFKSKDYPLFIVTFAHHQYNFLCGHSQSFIGVIKTILNQKGKTRTDDGRNKKIDFYEIGLRRIGLEIIEVILSKDPEHGNGRSLIDTKHMSPKARFQYHELVRKKRSHGDPIPIIQTHTGANGRPSMKDVAEGRADLELSKHENEQSSFFTGAINLFDDEIKDIVESDGLMGIMLDEKRIMGEKLPEDTEYFANFLPAEDQRANYFPDMAEEQEANKQLPKNKVKYHKKLHRKAINEMIEHRRDLELHSVVGGEYQLTPEQITAKNERIDKLDDLVKDLQRLLQDIFHSILLNQYLHIAKVINDKKVWNHVCIGSDYEGVINPLDIYFYASDLKDLKTDMIDYWKKAVKKWEDENVEAFRKYKDYLFGENIDSVVERILWGNSQAFLQKYFNDTYLKPPANVV